MARLSGASGAAFTQGYDAVVAAQSAIQSIGTINDITATAPSVSNVTTFSADRLAVTPDYTLPTMPNFNDVTYPIMPNVNNIIEYASEFLTDIKQWISDTITGFDTSLSYNIQSDMMDLTIERDLQKMSEEKYKESYKWSDGNWALPDGVLLSSSMSLESKYNSERYKRSNEIRLEVIKIAIERLHVAVENSVKIEQALQMYTITLNKIASQIFGAEVDVFTSEIKAIAAEIEGLTKEYTTRVSSYEAAYKIDEGNFGLATLANKVVSADVDASVSIMQQTNTGNIEAFSKTVANKIKAMDTAASACSALAGGYFASIHSSTNYGDTTSSDYTSSQNRVSKESKSNEYIKRTRYS